MCRKILLAVVAAMYVPFGNISAEEAKKPAAHGLVEVAAGKEAVLDTQLLVPVSEDISLIHRNRATWDYEGSVSIAYMLRARHKVIGGLTAEVGAAGSSAIGLIPRAGLGYFQKMGGLKAFQVALASDSDVLSITGATYHHPVSSDLSLVVSGENTGLINRDDWLPVIQQASIGFNYGNLEAGILGELTDGGATRGFVRGRF